MYDHSSGEKDKLMLTRRQVLTAGISLPFLTYTKPSQAIPLIAVQDSLLKGCHVFLLNLPGMQSNTTQWRNLIGPLHGVPTNFAVTTTATRGFAAETKRRGGYGELRLPNTNAGIEGGIFFPVDKLQFLEGMTMAFWVNLPATPDSATHRFLCAGATTATRAYGINNVASDARLNWIWSANNRLTMTGSLGTQTWRHVVATRTGTLATSMIARWYIDGALDSESAAITSDPTTSAGDYTTIGCRADGSLSPNALMDGIMLYDRALSLSEIKALYQDGDQGYPRLLSKRVEMYGLTTGGFNVRPLNVTW